MVGNSFKVLKDVVLNLTFMMLRQEIIIGFLVVRKTVVTDFMEKDYQYLLMKMYEKNIGQSSENCRTTKIL